MQVLDLMKLLGSTAVVQLMKKQASSRSGQQRAVPSRKINERDFMHEGHEKSDERRNTVIGSLKRPRPSLFNDSNDGNDTVAVITESLFRLDGGDCSSTGQCCQMVYTKASSKFILFDWN
jgi:hypothetical protein